MRVFPVRLPLVATAVAAAAVISCGDDPSPSYAVTLQISDSRLAANGSETANLIVAVIDENNVKPPTVGDTVAIQCQDTDGGEAGYIGTATEAGRGLATLDALGLDTLPIRCSGDDGSSYRIQCIAVYKGATGVLAPFDCVSGGGS